MAKAMAGRPTKERLLGGAMVRWRACIVDCRAADGGAKNATDDAFGQHDPDRAGAQQIRPAPGRQRERFLTRGAGEDVQRA